MSSFWKWLAILSVVAFGYTFQLLQDEMKENARAKYELNDECQRQRGVDRGYHEQGIWDYQGSVDAPAWMRSSQVSP